MSTARQARAAKRAPRGRRLRLLPATVLAAALLLTVRIGELWQGIDIGPTVAVAADGEEATAPTEEAATETAATEKAGTEEAGAPEGTGEEETPDLADFDRRFTEEEIAVLLDLARRRDELVARESEIEARSRLLDAAETRIDKRIAELEQLRTSLESLVRQYDTQEKAELESVVKIYETMKPKDAARILEELTMPVLMGIMEMMKERKTAAILAEMKGERARAVTAELARRREVDLSRVSGGAGADG